MEYKVISDRRVCGKVKDETLTKDDILASGGNVEFLLVSGHIVAANATKVKPAAKEEKEVKEEVQVTQQEEVPVLNSVNNQQGENQPWQE
jgi:hypothetical protein